MFKVFQTDILLNEFNTPEQAIDFVLEYLKSKSKYYTNVWAKDTSVYFDCGSQKKFIKIYTEDNNSYKKVWEYFSGNTSIMRFT